MVAIDVPGHPLTTLTYVREDGRIVFRGVVDRTNLEIFRDLLTMLPSTEDVVLSIAELDIRVSEASALLVERARSMDTGCRLIIAAHGSGCVPAEGVIGPRFQATDRPDAFGT